MNIEVPQPITLGFRAQRDGGLIRQNVSAPWDQFAEMLSKCHWSCPRSTAEDEDDTYDQELENEFLGDGTWLQTATGGAPSSEVTLVHALQVDVSDLSKEQILERLGGLTALGYTLYKHQPKEPGWKIIIPLATPVTVSIANAVHQKFFVERMTGGTIYNETEQDRWFPRPGCRADLREFFDHFKADGFLLDAEAVLTNKLNWDGSLKNMTTPSAGNAATPIVLAPVWATASDADLQSQLATLYASLLMASDFEAVGARIFEVELELNRRQKLAPAFRPLFQIPYRATEQKPVHKMVQRMRVVIDCHWLHTQLQRRQAVKELKWQALLDPTAPFPLDLSKDFAARAIKGAIRGDEVLNLTPFQQAQVRSMCGKLMREARKKAEDATSTGSSPLGRTLKALNQWAAFDHRLHVDKYEALARAESVLGGQKHTNSDLGALVGFATGGTPIAENRIRSMKNSLAEAVKKFE